MVECEHDWEGMPGGCLDCLLEAHGGEIVLHPVFPDVYQAERAVIEAARAFIEEGGQGRYLDLERTVLALDAAERGDDESR